MSHPLVALLLERTQYQICRRLGGLQGQLGPCVIFSPYWDLIHRWFSPYLHPLSFAMKKEKIYVNDDKKLYKLQIV